MRISTSLGLTLALVVICQPSKGACKCDYQEPFADALPLEISSILSSEVACLPCLDAVNSPVFIRNCAALARVSLGVLLDFFMLTYVCTFPHFVSEFIKPRAHSSTC